MHHRGNVGGWHFRDYPLCIRHCDQLVGHFHLGQACYRHVSAYVITHCLPPFPHRTHRSMRLCTRPTRVLRRTPSRFDSHFPQSSVRAARARHRRPAIGVLLLLPQKTRSLALYPAVLTYTFIIASIAASRSMYSAIDSPPIQFLRERAEDWVCLLRNNCIAEGANSLHPAGKPINHSTHSGFSCPETSVRKLL